MSHDHDIFLDLCAGNALGALDAGDRARLREHLKTGCMTCRKAMAALAEDAARLADTVAPIEPDPALKARVLQNLRARTQARPAAARPRPAFSWPTAAAAAVLIGVGGWWAYMNERGARHDADAQRAQAEQQAERRQAEADVRRSVLAAPGAIGIVLAPTPNAASAGTEASRVRVVYDPATDRAVLVAERLTPADGKVFELWTVRATGAQSLGLVAVNARGAGTLLIENIGGRAGLQAFAISLEEAGGAVDKTKPSADVGLAGALGG